MKHALFFLSSLLLLCLPAISLAETQVRPDGLEVSIIDEIPGKYARVKIVGVDPDAPLDKEPLRAIFREQLDRYGYEQMSLMVYNRGQDGQDRGLRAATARWFFEPENAIREVRAPVDIEGYKNSYVYNTKPDELYQAFLEDPQGAIKVYGNQRIGLYEYWVKRVYFERGMYCFEARMDHIKPGGRIDACGDRSKLLFSPQRGDIEDMEITGEIISFDDGVLLIYITRASG